MKQRVAVNLHSGNSKSFFKNAGKEVLKQENNNELRKSVSVHPQIENKTMNLKEKEKNQRTPFLTKDKLNMSPGVSFFLIIFSMVCGVLTLIRINIIVWK
jgi:hypothetical protein